MDKDPAIPPFSCYVQAEQLESLAHGVLTGGYEATRFKAKAATSQLSTVHVHTGTANADEALQAGSAYGKGTLLAR